MIREDLALNHDWEQRTGSTVHEGLLIEEPGIDVVKGQGGPHGHVDEPAPLGLRLTSPRRAIASSCSNADAARAATVRRWMAAKPRRL